MISTNRLSKRLKKVASFITKGSCFADIGSDHAYLPCYVCLKDKEAKAVAGEVAKKPFKRAHETVEKLGLSKRISVRYGDGLDVIREGEIDSIVLAGMGGTLMAAILENGWSQLIGVNRIIVQPNTGEPDIRRWLEEHGYPITHETIINENNHIYEIIAADKSTRTWPITEKQLLFGPHLLYQKSEAFYQKWQHEHFKRLKIIEQMKQAAEPDKAKLKAMRQELVWIEEVLNNDSNSAK